MDLGVSEKKKLMRSNPIIYKLESYTKHVGYMTGGTKTAERAASKAGESLEDVSTYAGIKSKTLYFVLMTIIGFIGFFALHGVFKSSPARFGALPQFVLESSIHQIDITITELVLFLAAALVTAIMPFIAAIFKGSIPTVGTIYTVCQGYFIGFLTGLLKVEYRFIPVLAFMITAGIVLTMLYVYNSGKIEVTDKFKSIMYSFFGTAVICTIISTILYVLPFSKEMVGSYFTFLNSPAVSLAISILFFVAAVLFLLVDFDTIKECVEKGLQQKYEWMVAWGLAYSIIYIYMRIFSYITRIVSLVKKTKK